MRAEVPLPRALPTPNSRIHYMRRAAWTKQIRQDAQLAIRSAMNAAKVERATGYRRLTMTLVRGPGQHMLDMDNAIAGMKPILDSCAHKDVGLITGDSLAEVMVTYRQERGAAPMVWVDYDAAGENRG